MLTEEGRKERIEQQEINMKYLRRRLQRYHDDKYSLALRDNSGLTREQWANDWVQEIFSMGEK